MNDIFVKTRTIKDYIVSVSLFILGLSATILGQEGLAIAGVFSIILGVILLIVMKSGWRNQQDGTVCKERILYFSAVRKTEILNALEKDPSKIQIDKNDQSGPLKLDIKYCRKAGYANCQLSEYIPYNYEPCSKVYSYDISLLENLLK